MSRSSTATTLACPTLQPPRTSPADPACCNSGSSTCTNQPISCSAAARLARQARRRLAITSSGIAAAAATTSNPSSHHTHDGVPFVSDAAASPGAVDVVGAAEGVGSSVGAGVSVAVSVGVAVSVVVWVGVWVGVWVAVWVGVSSLVGSVRLGLGPLAVSVVVGVGVWVGVSSLVVSVRVALGSVRLGLGLLTVTLGSTVPVRDGSSGRVPDPSPSPPHELSRMAATARPSVRSTRDIGNATPLLLDVSITETISRRATPPRCSHEHGSTTSLEEHRR